MAKFENKIINEDSLKILKKIPNKTFDLIFADPPYNLQIEKKLRRPDNSKVNGVADKWDQFKNFEHYDNFCKKWLDSCIKCSTLKPSLDYFSIEFVCNNTRPMIVLILCTKTIANKCYFHLSNLKILFHLYCIWTKIISFNYIYN